MTPINFCLSSQELSLTLEVNAKKFTFLPKNIVSEGNFTLDMEGHTVIFLGNITASGNIQIKTTSLFALNILCNAGGDFECEVKEKGYFLHSGIKAINTSLKNTTHLGNSVDLNQILAIKNAFKIALNERDCDGLIKNLICVANLLKDDNQDNIDAISNLENSLKFLEIPILDDAT